MKVFRTPAAKDFFYFQINQPKATIYLYDTFKGYQSTFL